MDIPQDIPDNICCSFCGKSLKDVRQIVAGLKSYICDECVQLCQEIFSYPNDDPDEYVLLNRLHVSKFVSAKLGQLISPKHITRCEFYINCPGGGGAPSVKVRGSGQHGGRDFYFNLSGVVWGNEHGLVMNHLAELEAEWE